jgi:hypothetical protein
MDVVNQYVAELRRLKEAVRTCMETYEHADVEGAAKVTSAGQPL